MSFQAAWATEGSRLHRLTTWFDTESAAVVTILLGLFQLLLSSTVAYTEQGLPNFFMLPLILGITVVAAGSFTMANERNPSRILLYGCACSNLVGLLTSLLAFCIFLYSLRMTHAEDQCSASSEHFHDTFSCPPLKLADYSWSVTLLLLLYDSGAVVLHCLLSVAAFKTLKTH